MTNQNPEPRGTAAESEEWVTGEGGPSFTQGGMTPGGSEMQNWKKPPEGGESEPPIEEQAENLRDRIENQ